ncbi:hypothetical protein LPMP_130810 [Leishmania panamensis]|uniref:Uncharacterized protein n=1 Tax=Leishmania panamensis TaxID=5679 RepID=A0A088RKZ9_LEIPA|nr:hypothetical protein LPMP_130810 [Leishmania panamensis]AIN96510.1 hypothetical protein LPMP_130810 [Leishmania panamensis]
MPQQLPVLRHEQQAQSSLTPVSSSLISPTSGNDRNVCFGPASRTSVSVASIASTQRALLPSCVGCTVVVPSLQHQQHEKNNADVWRSRKAASASKAVVPIFTAAAAATATSSIRLSESLAHTSVAAAAAAPSLHLEYVGLGPSLARESYLPHAESPGAHDSASTRSDVLALQDATTGLFVRHLGLNSLPATVQADDDDGDEGGAAVPRGGDDDGDRASPTASSALMGATPVISTALLEAGVDHRISPFLLDQLIQRSYRRTRSTVAASGKRGLNRKGQLQNGLKKPTFLKGTAASLQRGGGTAAVMLEGPAAELHYHELPAIQAASEAHYTSTPGSGGTGGGATSAAVAQPNTGAPAASGTKQLLDLIAEYANDLNAGETVGKTPHATAPGMSSTEHAHIAAAVSSNDGALVRQLVEHYCTRIEAISPTRTSTRAAVVVPPTRANMQSRTTSKDKNARAGPGANGGDASEGGAASPAFPLTSATPAFSLLDAVMCVSREFVAQRSAAGVPGQSTSALSERRRRLLERLTSLDQTRIPETWWVTSLPYLGRLVTATGRRSSTAASAVSVGEEARHVSMLATADRTHTRATRMSRASRMARSGGTTSSPPVESWASEQSDEFRCEADTAVKEAIQKASVIRTGPVDSEALSSGVGGQIAFGAGASHNIFPAVRPVERSQVYLLAEVLDRMLRDPSHPRWLSLLADPQVARYVLADDDDTEDDNAQRRSSSYSTLDTSLWGTPGEQRLLAYTDAATHVLEILDTGLAELVRQVASYCVERGALLDLLRQSTMDIASAHVHLLSQVKQQAHVDALATQTLRKEKAQLQQELEATRKALEELQSTHAALCTRVEPLQRKSDRLDELVARVAAKARRFETSRHDEHAALLQVLKESMEQSAGAALDSFFTEMHGLQARHEGLEEGAATTHRATAAEMPSVTVARSQALEQRQTMEQLYTVSYRLLHGLQDAITATNSLCGRLCDKMILKDVSPAAKVATSRWAAVARAVGAFEKDKRHRQRVYEVFMEYCTEHRHKRGAKADLEAVQTGYTTLNNTASIARQDCSYGEAFLVNDSKVMQCCDNFDDDKEPSLVSNESSALLTLTEETSPDERRPRRKNSTAKNEEGVDIDQAAASAAGAREQMQHEVVMTGTIITRDDLEAMQATDCTVEEVNALFRRDFNIYKYLHGSWQQYVLERLEQAQQGTGAVTTKTSGPGEHHTAVEKMYTLRLPDVLQMLSDVSATLAEVTVRMNAMTSSAVLQAGLQPPLEPPSHPEQPCPLCNRRDACELERQRRREAMSRIARDLQSKMDAVEAKSRAALTGRDEALREVRRLKMELQHSGTTAPARGSAALGAQQQQEMQLRSSQGHRQQRRRSSHRHAAADSPVTGSSVHQAPLRSLGSGSTRLGSSNSGTMEATGCSESSVGVSTGILTPPDKCLFPPITSVASLGTSMSPQHSRISFFDDVHVGDSFTTASYEDSSHVGHLSIPVRRRSTAQMVAKPGHSAAQADSPSSLSVTNVTVSPRTSRKSGVEFLVTTGQEGPLGDPANAPPGNYTEGGGVTNNARETEVEARRGNARAAEMPNGNPGGGP